MQPPRWLWVGNFVILLSVLGQVKLAYKFKESRLNYRIFLLIDLLPSFLYSVLQVCTDTTPALM